MGQGYSSSSVSAGAASIEVPELTDLSFEKSIGDARFLKAIRARHRNGLVVAKIAAKPSPNTNFKSYVKAIEDERKLLLRIPNALPYHRVLETGGSGYLIRQFIYSSLYDRISTRPFLEDIEKKWLAFQLLTVVREMHSQNTYHGDIKMENVLVTSWNWLYLTDFSSSYKPTYLPEDNPADFSFYFDISGRRSCCVAPERFLSTGESTSRKAGITWAMDIFSTGCVIGELFLETPVFTLSQLFKYRQAEHDPIAATLKKINDPDVRDLVAHMLQLEPESRYSADEYLNFWRQKTFPDYFYSFLHQYMHLVTESGAGRSELTAGKNNMGESDERIEMVYSDFDKIAYFLAPEEDRRRRLQAAPLAIGQTENIALPLHVDMTNGTNGIKPHREQKRDGRSLLFIGIITSALRSTARSSAKIKACDLLLAFSANIEDEAKMDRIVPFIVCLFDDVSDVVRAIALRTLACLLQDIDAASPVHAYLFPEYIIPKLNEMSQVKRGARLKPFVRITYAQSMAPLVESASRFLDSAQGLKAEGTLPNPDPEVTEDRLAVQPSQDLYDIARADLSRFFEIQTKALLTDNDANVRQAFLSSVPSLCVFFGESKANDVLLSHLNTYLNDRDWRLRCAFFKTIVGVAAYIGSSSLEEFILPLLVQALSDAEETVVETVIHSLATMAQMGLFQRSATWELIDLLSKFLVHPNAWIRGEAVSFISSSTRFLSVADKYCIVLPKIMPFLTKTPDSFIPTTLTGCLKSELPRAVYDLALNWASKTDRGVFWNDVKTGEPTYRHNQRPFDALRSRSESNSFTLDKVYKTEEDQQWLRRLQHGGLGIADESKLLTLRPYIYQVTGNVSKPKILNKSDALDGMVALGELKTTLNNVLFDQKRVLAQGPLSAVDKDAHMHDRPQTIADALLDASTTVGLVDNTRSSSPNAVAGPNSDKMFATSDRILTGKISPTASSSLAPSLRDRKHSGTVSSRENPVSTVARNQLAGKGAETPQPGTIQNQFNRSKPALRHRSSAIDLMSPRHISGKAFAATSTSSANALGTLAVDRSRDSSPMKTILAAAREEKARHPHEVKYEQSHDYAGRDPHVLRLLDNVFLDQYPVDLMEFGPNITRISQMQDTYNAPNSLASGTLVAMFSEHTKAIRHVVPAPDHAFFLTGSDDGTVRIWDTSRLERNLAHRSRQTHRHGPETRISALCFVEDTHTFVSAATDGTIDFVKVDCTMSTGATSKYGKLMTLRHWELPNQKPSMSKSLPYATCLTHCKAADTSKSTLLVASSDCTVRALDLATMDVLYTLDTPAHHGVPSALCIDADRQWLLVGTTHGVLDLWDLRFQLRLKSAAFPAAQQIEQIVLCPGARGKLGGRKVCVAGGTGEEDITIWDVQRLLCKEVFRTQAAGIAHEKSTACYSALKPDDYSPKSMLERIETAQRTPHATDPLRTTAIFALSAALRTTSSARADQPARGHGYLVAGGSDAAVRYWDLEDPEYSRIISGADHVGAGQEQRSSNGNKKKGSKGESSGTVTYERVTGVEMTIWEERVQGRRDEVPDASITSSRREVDQSIEGSGSRRANVGVRRDRGSSSREEARSMPTTATAAEATEATTKGNKAQEGEPEGKEPTSSMSSRHSRQTAVSQYQHRMLRSHLDVVTACCVLESPFRVVVSADRSGVVYIYS